MLPTAEVEVELVVAEVEEVVVGVAGSSESVASADFVALELRWWWWPLCADWVDVVAVVEEAVFRSFCRLVYACWAVERLPDCRALVRFW